VTPPLKSTYLFFVVLVCVGFARCGMSAGKGNGMEGTIVYDVTFPYEQNTIMLDLFPKEMVFQFKGSMMRSQIKSSYDLLTTDFIIDNNDKTITQMLKNMSDRYSMSLNGDEVGQWLKNYPTVTLETTTETENIAGYVCNKTVAHFANDSIPPITLYHTKGLGINTENWWNQFNGVEGFLMGYEMQQYGKRMRLRAREVRFEPIDEKVFEHNPNFKGITMQEMDAHLQQVVSEFMK
jgi:hypothetical protein